MAVRCVRRSRRHVPADLDHRPRADATPVILRLTPGPIVLRTVGATGLGAIPLHRLPRSVHIASVLAPAALTTGILVRAQRRAVAEDRKSTRLNSSHVAISYAVFCLKKKKKHRKPSRSDPTT